MRGKRILAVAAGLVLILVIGGIILFGFVFPPSRIAAEVLKRAEAATGLDLEIERAGLGFGRGGIEVKLLGLDVREPKKPEPAILELERLDLGVALGPLFSRQVQITHLVLERPAARAHQGRVRAPERDALDPARRASPGRGAGSGRRPRAGRWGWPLVGGPGRQDPGREPPLHG